MGRSGEALAYFQICLVGEILYRFVSSDFSSRELTLVEEQVTELDFKDPESDTIEILLITIKTES